MRFAMSIARDLKRRARCDEDPARFLKQEERCNVALSGNIRSVHGGASRWEPFDYFDHAREETRMAEALAGESRKIADEARDFLRKAREAVSGALLHRLRRGEERLLKAEAAYYDLWDRQVEKMREHKDILKRVYGRGRVSVRENLLVPDMGR